LDGGSHSAATHGHAQRLERIIGRNIEAGGVEAGRVETSARRYRD
jgi:hypothetical protein